ncbi:porphobilinogen synthase [Demequina sp. SYSU T00039]|uniref:Delta-aminolevulinic acid dehydratase n=1 Tax=Demequina lignilytica TaxID=3051663 RepID=A0AAW7M851_9MICO|nr:MULTISPECIES: porphobilinogen synthase [unclassified Demequina]MDN4478417.1 porphobilinogen synthase [Demequina sp. SYSU T00039-1]MDN4487076.1 porphobilinogen synthase [Demequina sp. SYSU T00039]
MQHRPRRLRTTPAMRRLVREVRPHAAELVLPVFIHEDLAESRPIASLPGVSQHPLSAVPELVAACVAARIGGIMLFAIPSVRDAEGSGACAADGILNRAIASAAEASGERLVVMADLCLDEFTDHGHCGVLAADGSVDNDATLEVYAQMGVAQARAGAHVLGLSGMMDGQTAAVRAELDAAGLTDVSLLAYAAKYASAFYGPFRDAVESQLEGDRRTYQMDPANGREGLREAELDALEGADIVMVKPALPYLDVVAEVAAESRVPVAAYHVSGEYAQIEAAAANGWIDRRAAHLEALTSMRRAGADIVVTYAALELAAWLEDL